MPEGPPTMFYAKLLECRKNKRLVGYCRWKDGKGLLFGRVVDVTRTRARFALVNPDGKFDEEQTEQLRDITRIVSEIWGQHVSHSEWHDSRGGAFLGRACCVRDHEPHNITPVRGACRCLLLFRRRSRRVRLRRNECDCPRNGQ
jgi:hypothetical protein